MPEEERIPQFPPPSVVDRVLELGFGSGPWNRAELTTLWGESAANKTVQEAKAFGWLVSPFPGEFYVPPAQDLTTVGWLPPVQRQEFIISRTWATTGFRFWCFSAWARNRGIEFGIPLFVTDFSPDRGRISFYKTSDVAEVPTLEELRDRNIAIAKRTKRMPFEESLLIVPYLPQSSTRAFPSRVTLPRGRTSKPSGTPWFEELEGGDFDEMGRRVGRHTTLDSRAIRVLLPPPVDDSAWVIALLLALGMPRLVESLPSLKSEVLQREALTLRRKQEQGPEPEMALLQEEAFRIRARLSEPLTEKNRQILQEELERLYTRLDSMARRRTLAGENLATLEQDFTRRVRKWSSLLGSPVPNELWRKVLTSGTFPYLLVPPALWQEISTASSASRFSSLGKMLGG